MVASATPRVVSLTPAVFHLPDAVNQVSRTYGESPIVPRGPRLRPLLDRARHGIVEALGAPGYEAILLTGSGSTSMAAVLGSCLRRDERLLVVRNGAYGDRIFEYAGTLGQPVVDMCLPYGERPDLARIEAILAADEADAVAIVHGGTSTCTLNPVPEVGALARKYGKKLLVDGISALFVEPMALEGSGIAAVMGSCNKGLHSHPNLTVALVRKDLLAEMERIPARVPSLELYKTWRAQQGGAHPYTIDPMSLCQVIAALDHLAATGGVAGRHAVYQARCAILRPGYERLGFAIARWENMPLQSIGTALHIPAGRTYDEMASRLASEPVDGHVFEIYAAQGKLSSQLFRIFHMGEYPLEVYEIFLRALARVV
ncbi:pyridoxal-phosphate-dependent aminotransferase family protein [Sorangium sp. So ce1153]|uniref:pyridoxal-phosphate-dependent aminotransferase family protein n=1 Tax=Sorangium sp. So ce1153 TaxID=3133333 RepID=UPI003F5EAB88